MSNHILTYSKIMFNPLDPVEEDIKIEDIAHALSLMTRANGHFSHFYSVAQHSLNCCKEARSRGYNKRIQLGCLLHDASESYLSDITRPVKKNLTDYAIIEENLQKAIYHKFGLGDLSDEENEKIREVDDTLLHVEFEVFMGPGLFPTSYEASINHDLSPRSFFSVEREFLSLFYGLMGVEKNSFTDLTCVGVDGCKDGWVAVGIKGSNFELNVHDNIADLFTNYGSFEPIIIDMPIGLPESMKDVRPEIAARTLLKGKSSSIFNPPCRQAVYANTYWEANEINKQILGKGLSKQSYAISGKIKEIDQFLLHHPHYKNKVLEGHPELCFAKLNAGVPLFESKKSYFGIRKRIDVLSHYYEKTEELIAYASDNRRYKTILDDVIDALCLAVTGMISREKGVKTIPENPMEDPKGILMQMVYPG